MWTHPWLRGLHLDVKQLLMAARIGGSMEVCLILHCLKKACMITLPLQAGICSCHTSNALSLAGAHPYIAQGFTLHFTYPPKPNGLPEVVRGASCVEFDLVLCLHLPWLLCGNRHGCTWEQACVKQVGVGREERIQVKRKGGPGKRRAVMHSPCVGGVKGGGGAEEAEGRAGKGVGLGRAE